MTFALNTYKEGRTRYVCSRLELWSEYLIQSQDNNQGYPSRVSYAQMMAQSSGYRSVVLIPVTHDDFNEIDALVHRLPLILQEVVISEWIWSGTQQDKARKRGVNRETYRNRLRWAYEELLKMGI